MAKRYSLAGCRASNNRWDFPKGEIEPGEEPLAAARREVAEETGLTDLRFRWGECFTDTPPYAQGKVARYYIAESRTGEFPTPIRVLYQYSRA